MCFEEGRPRPLPRGRHGAPGLQGQRGLHPGEAPLSPLYVRFQTGNQVVVRWLRVLAGPAYEDEVTRPAAWPEAAWQQGGFSGHWAQPAMTHSGQGPGASPLPSQTARRVLLLVRSFIHLFILSPRGISTPTLGSRRGLVLARPSRKLQGR
ncbi:uncharacterized protein [Sagmatias obliquidens]|uniref:uncharacterized protein isoform X2 n=1 Tax=Sagmatias obliquidens TaxID=3371155 RepID=UPI000F444887|nr:uncharacterized protein LOC113607277 isoform X2 [Lagenorhynchus obliquidens]